MRGNGDQLASPPQCCEDLFYNIRCWSSSPLEERASIGPSCPTLKSKSADMVPVVSRWPSPNDSSTHSPSHRSSVGSLVERGTLSEDRNVDEDKFYKVGRCTLTPLQHLLNPPGFSP